MSSNLYKDQNLTYLQFAFFILLQFITTISCSYKDPTLKIYGRWVGQHNEHDLSLIFNSDHTCSATFFNSQSNSTDTINGKYELIFSKYPNALSIIDIRELNYSLHTIFEFTGENSMRIVEFSPKWRLRPISFEEGKTIDLNRIL